MKRSVVLNTIIFLSVLGIITSLYLVQNHYAPPVEGSLCDLSESVSCSLVNSSTYSMLFNVPVALFGTLWFVVLGLMAQASKKKNPLILSLIGWNVVGLIFVIYLIIAEIILQALCPFCTVVHVITLITFALSIMLYRGLSAKEKNFAKKNYVKSSKSWIVGIIILNLIPLIIFNIPGGVEKDHTNLAQCITESGVNMYGSFRCGVCAKTRSMFGDSFEQINEIECHPQGENPQTELCLSKGIEGTPTWILEPEGVEQKRYRGFLSLEELAEFSGCPTEELAE